MTSTTTYCRPCDAHHDSFGIPECTYDWKADAAARRADSDAALRVMLLVPTGFFAAVAALVAVL